MEWKTIIVLAKSYKKGHWCVAGKELVENNEGKYDIHGWIRPVSSDGDSQGAISDDHCHLNKGGHANILDIVRVPFNNHAPEPGQPENWLISDGTTWELVKRHSSGQVRYFEDKPGDLWLEHGIETDRISLGYEMFTPITQSLNLIRPSNFYVTLAQDYNAYDGKYKKHITADFIYNGVHYENLSITDPKVRRMLGKQYPAEGDEPNRIRLNHNDNYYLCVSLGPRFGHGDRHYKFIATIFDFDGYIQTHY